MRVSGVAGAQRRRRRCEEVGALVRERGGVFAWDWRRYRGVARYSILGVNGNQSEPIRIHRGISDKLGLIPISSDKLRWKKNSRG